jgi:adenylylsulfate reductase subunit B
MGHSVRVLREPEKGMISWRIKFRNGHEKHFVSPIRTTPWGIIPSPAELPAPSEGDYKDQSLAHEPDALNIEGGLPALSPDQLRKGVV